MTNAELKSIGKALVDRLDEIEAPPAFKGIWPYLHVHNYTYTGPSWEEPLKAARKAFK